MKNKWRQSGRSRMAASETEDSDSAGEVNASSFLGDGLDAFAETTTREDTQLPQKA